MKINTTIVRYVYNQFVSYLKEETFNTLMFSLFSAGIEDDVVRLNQKNNLLFSIFNSITDGLFFVNNEWDILYWNKTAEAIIGLEQDNAIGKNLWDIYADAKELDFFKQYNKAKQENIAVEFESYYPTKNIWLEVKAYPFAEGLAVYFKDVTDKKKLALSIESYLNQQESIINATPDVIWSVDTNLKLLLANNAFINGNYNLTGITIKTGDHILTGYPEQVVKKWENYYKKALSGISFSIDETVVDDGLAEANYINVNFNPIYDVTASSIIGVACYSRDVTERVKYERLLEEKNKQLEAKELELKELTIHLETVLNSSLDIICTINVSKEISHINNAAKYLLGYEPEELIGKHFSIIVHPDDISKTNSISSELLKGSTVTNFRNRLVRKSGLPINIIWSARWDIEKGLMFAVGRDASEIVKAETSKAEVERRLSALIQKGADMICILNEEGKYLFVSPNVHQILGYNENDLIGKSAFDLIHPEDIPVSKNEFSTLLQTGEIKQISIRFLNAAGEWKWIEIAGTNLLNDPAVNGVVINSRDITDRKLQEEELRKSNERFEMAVKVSNEVIYDWNLSTGEMIWNKNFGDVFGYKHINKELNLEFWKSHVHPDDINRVMESLNLVLEKKRDKKWSSEYRFIKDNGDIANVFEQGFLITDENNCPIRMVGSIRDITERKKKELEREQFIVELTRTNADLKQFSFITSHNLRAPLSNIVGLLNVVDEENLNGVNSEIIHLLKTSANHLKNTIEDLSTIVTIRNKQNVDIGELDLQCTFEKISSTYLNTTNDIPHVLQANFAVRVISFHKPYIESLFITLLSNAVKFRSRKRTLHLQVTSSIEETGRVAITISDNGIGMDSNKYKDRLFGMYQTFHEGFEGKGLGLFTVKSQINALGGTVDLVSETDKGTTVTVVLPKWS